MPKLVHFSSKSELGDLLAAKNTWSARFLQAPRGPSFHPLGAAPSAEPNQNVVGVGIGEKMEDGRPTGILAVKFFVRRKYGEEELSKKNFLPKTIDGLPVDVEQTGLFRALAVKKKQRKPKPLGPKPNPKERFRPAQPGCSVGFQFAPPNTFVMAGTFGALVKNSAGSYILSNNHVLAEEGHQPLGAPIFQPGLLDGGRPKKDRVATLTKFIPLQPGVMNDVDAAIAKGDKAGILSRDILHIGPPAGTAAAAIDMRVHKFGRTTSYTVGHITSIATDVTVAYESGHFMFADQIIIVGDQEPFSAGGDSGSLILERQTNNAVGLLFAGSVTHTIACHIDTVLQALGVTLS